MNTTWRLMAAAVLALNSNGATAPLPQPKLARSLGIETHLLNWHLPGS
jgi:hypothetical protein